MGTYVMHRELQPEEGAGVAGAILMSGQYHPDPQNPGPFEKAYYGADTENYPKKAALHHILFKNMKIYYLRIPKSKKHLLRSFPKWSVVLKRRENGEYYELKIMADPGHILNFVPFIKRGENLW